MNFRGDEREMRSSAYVTQSRHKLMCLFVNYYDMVDICIDDSNINVQLFLSKVNLKTFRELFGLS